MSSNFITTCTRRKTCLNVMSVLVMAPLPYHYSPGFALNQILRYSINQKNLISRIFLASRRINCIITRSHKKQCWRLIGDKDNI